MVRVRVSMRKTEPSYGTKFGFWSNVQNRYSRINLPSANTWSGKTQQVPTQRCMLGEPGHLHLLLFPLTAEHHHRGTIPLRSHEKCYLLETDNETVPDQMSL